MKLKERFWYESNACWGWVETIAGLVEKCKLQIDPKYGALANIEEFLDKSMRHFDHSLNFGTRGEHTGKQSLGQYLNETAQLDAFLSRIGWIETNTETGRPVGDPEEVTIKKDTLDMVITELADYALALNGDKCMPTEASDMMSGKMRVLRLLDELNATRMT